MIRTILFASFLSFPALADFSSVHTSLCAGVKDSCQLVLAPTDVPTLTGRCEGKLSDITCRVMLLKTPDSATMNLICGDVDSPLLSQVLESEVLSYSASAIVKKKSGEYVTLNDPKSYHLVSSPALDLQLSVGEKVTGKMVMSLQDRSIELTNVTCD